MRKTVALLCALVLGASALVCVPTQGTGSDCFESAATATQGAGWDCEEE